MLVGSERFLVAATKEFLCPGGDRPIPAEVPLTAKKETADLLRKHGGKTGEELKGGGN